VNNDAALVSLDARLKVVTDQIWAANLGPMAMTNQVDLSGRTLTINGAQPVTITGNVISGSGAMVQAGAGLLTLSGNNSFGGGLTVQTNSTVLLGSDTAAGSSVVTAYGGTLTIASGAQRSAANNITGTTVKLNVPASSSLTLSGAISAPTVEKHGAGALNLSGNFNFFTQLTIASGRVALTGPGGDIIPNFATVTLENGAMLDLLNKTERFDTLSLGSGGGILNLAPDGVHGVLTLDDLALNGQVLTIQGWQGANLSPGTDDRIYVDNFSGDILELKNRVYFDGFGWGGVLLDNELVPIPEPGPVLLLALGGGLALLSRRMFRRRS
jgi:autotransporter-associated beta strand protein